MSGVPPGIARRVAVAALPLPFAAVLLVPLVGASGLELQPSFLSGLSGKWWSGAVPLGGALVGAAGVAAGRWWPGRIRMAALLLAGVVPALTACLEAFWLAQRGDPALCDDSLTTWGVARALSSDLGRPLQVASEGCLRSGFLLLVVTIFVGRGVRVDWRRRLHALAVPAGIAIGAMGVARLLARTHLRFPDYMSMVAAWVAIAAVGGSIACAPRARRPALWWRLPAP